MQNLWKVHKNYLTIPKPYAMIYLLGSQNMGITKVSGGCPLTFLCYSGSFRSFYLIQPIFLSTRPKTQVKTAGRMKQIITKPIQSMAVMAALVPSATSLTQPE